MLPGMLDCLGCCPVTLRRDATQMLSVGRTGLDRLIADGVLSRIDRSTVVGRCLVEQAASDPMLAHEIRLRALLLAYPDAAGSHESAAATLSLPLLTTPYLAIATRARGAWRGGANSRIRIAPLPPHHVTCRNGIRATDMPRTVVDIARCATTREAVVPGDAALRRGCTQHDLMTTLEETAMWSDVGKPRRLLKLLDANAESPLESVSRIIMHGNHLPPPLTQVWLTGSDGRPYRVDFYWPEQRLIGEADGMAKYDDPEALRAEKRRQERLEQAGFRVVRWSWSDMLRDTAATIWRIRRYLDS